MDIATGTLTPHLRFCDWTQNRDIPTHGTNAGAQVLPFQGWRRFKEAFAPELIYNAITETAGTVSHVVDPFGGSGTTALACQFLGVRPTTIEVNPYLADLIEAKIAPIDVDAAAAAFAHVVQTVATSDPIKQPCFDGAPKTFVEPGVDGRFIFSREVAARIIAYRDAISLEEDLGIQRLFRVTLAAVTVPVSNIVVSGKGRRYRGGWNKRRISPNSVDLCFREGVLRALYDLRRFSDRRCRSYDLLRGDARELIRNVAPLDLAVFSPPYPNSFDYTDVYNVELWTMGYLRNGSMNAELRRKTVRSHVQIHRDMSFDGMNSKLLRETIDQLNNIADRLWNRHIPAMIGAYMGDMATVLAELSRKLRQRGRIFMVVGDSRYGEVDVPTARILSEIGPSLGLRPVRVEPYRSMRASPQQGGRRELAETLVVFER